MISTGTLMVGKALLTATVLIGFFVSQLIALKRMKRQDEDAKRHSQDQPPPEARPPYEDFS